MRTLERYNVLTFFSTIQAAEKFDIQRSTYLRTHLIARRVRLLLRYNYKFYQKCLEEVLRSDVGFTDERGINFIINKLKRKKCVEDLKKAGVTDVTNL